jgi:hypothetical protein
MAATWYVEHTGAWGWSVRTTKQHHDGVHGGMVDGYIAYRLMDAGLAHLIAAAPRLLKACEDAREAFRLTREYVGEDMLPEIPGWSWYDADQELGAAITKATA